MITVQCWTGAEVKVLRRAMRLSMRDFAEHLGVSTRSVSNWEGREAAITPVTEMQRTLDTALARADGAVRERFAQAVASSRQAQPAEPAANAIGGPVERTDAVAVPMGSGPGDGALLLAALADFLGTPLITASAGTGDLYSADGVDAYQLTEYLRRWGIDMNRREHIRLLVLAAINLAASPLLSGLGQDGQERVAQVVAVPGRVDAATLGHVEAVLHAAKQLDDALGPQAALDTVLAQRKLAHTLLAGCSPELRPHLLTLYGKLTHAAGCMSFDVSDFESASYYYEQARVTAHEAENTDLGIAVLIDMSYLATWRHQPWLGIDHAVAAQHRARDTDDLLLRSLTADVAARAYAGAGARRDCLDALDTAQHGIADVPPQTPATSLAYCHGPGPLATTRSRCLLQLGEAGEAERAAQESLALVGSSFVRNRAFATFSLGNAYVAAGEVNEAARVIGDGAALTVQNRSTRLVDELGRARAGLQMWPDAPAVRELDDKLAAYGLVSSSKA